MARTRLNKKIANQYLKHVGINSKLKDEFAARSAKQRRNALKRWYKNGGEYLIEWAKLYYKTHDRASLDLSEKFYIDFLKLFGNPWVQTQITQKGAQVGFTEALILLTVFCLAELRIPCAYGVERQAKLRDIVGPRVQPVLKGSEVVQQICEEYKVIQQDIDTKARNITVGGIPVTFFYATVASLSQTREASSSLSSFTAWLAMVDEIELIPRKALEVVPGRMEASPLPTRPIRYGSTPGASGGTVDRLIKESGVLFKWNVTCDNCKTEQFLDPLGNLLKAVEVERAGRTESRYTDLLGRPVNWHCHDNTNLESRIKSAYVGCRHCNQPLGESVYHGEYRWGTVSLDSFLAGLNSPMTEPVGLLLPKLASSRFNPTEKIRHLMKNENVAVVFQEELGCVSDEANNKIPVEAILEAQQYEIPESKQENSIVVFGIDQGIEFNWLIIIRYYFSEDPHSYAEEDWNEEWKASCCEILHWGKVYRFGLSQRNVEPEFDLNYYIDRYKPYLIGFDLKPDTSSGMDFALTYSPEMVLSEPYTMAFMELELKDGKYQAKNKKIQGTDVQYFSLHRNFAMDAVRDRILQGLVKFPQMPYNTESDNLIHHLTTSEKDTKTYKWNKPTAPDHGHHCWGFCEAALYAYRFENAYRQPAFVFLDSPLL